jgi:hypothetical protein
VEDPRGAMAPAATSDGSGAGRRLPRWRGRPAWSSSSSRTSAMSSA